MAADEEVVVLGLVLLIVDKVLLKTDEVDDVDAIDEAEDAELELLMLEALKLGLPLLENDGLLLLAEELVLDVRDVVAWLHCLMQKRTSTGMQSSSWKQTGSINLTN